MGPLLVPRLLFLVEFTEGEKSTLGPFMVTINCLLKNIAQNERCVKFYFRQNEDYSPGDSISDSSEKLLQKGRLGRSVYM